jgi:hypothetical protein
VLRLAAAGHYVASVRAPLASSGGAGDLCAKFGGAGRAAAAGIDRLPPAGLERFIEAFEATTWGRAPRLASLPEDKAPSAAALRSSD